MLFVIQVKNILAWIGAVGWTIFLFYQDNEEEEIGFFRRKNSQGSVSKRLSIVILENNLRSCLSL